MAFWNFVMLLWIFFRYTYFSVALSLNNMFGYIMVKKEFTKETLFRRILAEKKILVIQWRIIIGIRHIKRIPMWS